MRLAECFDEIFAFTLSMLDVSGGDPVPEVVANDVSDQPEPAMPASIASLIARHEPDARQAPVQPQSGDGINLEKVRDTYCRLFTASSDKAVRNNFSDSDYRLAKFAVCAWVDERIVASNITDRLQWHSMELQRLYFQTTNAGEEFFTCLASLRPTQSAVMEVFSLCLSLGFQGKYFGQYESEELRGIKRAVARGVLGRSPEIADNKGLSMMQAYPGEMKNPAGVTNDLTLKLVLILIPLVIIVGMFFAYSHLLENLRSSLL